MRGNPDGSLSSPGAPRADPALHHLATKAPLSLGPALSFRRKDRTCLRTDTPCHAGVVRDKVMAGGTPANPAALVVYGEGDADGDGEGDGLGVGVGIGLGLGPGARLRSSTSNTRVEFAGMTTVPLLSFLSVGP
jgi:hypothetical protein